MERAFLVLALKSDLTNGVRPFARRLMQAWSFGVVLEGQDQ
jgi:hypothetical protein